MDVTFMPVKTFEASDKTSITLSCVKVPLSNSAGLGLPTVGQVDRELLWSS